MLELLLVGLYFLAICPLVIVGVILRAKWRLLCFRVTLTTFILPGYFDQSKSIAQVKV